MFYHSFTFRLIKDVLQKFVQQFKFCTLTRLYDCRWRRLWHLIWSTSVWNLGTSRLTGCTNCLHLCQLCVTERSKLKTSINQFGYLYLHRYDIYICFKNVTKNTPHLCLLVINILAMSSLCNDFFRLAVQHETSANSCLLHAQKLICDLKLSGYIKLLIVSSQYQGCCKVMILFVYDVKPN